MRRLLMSWTPATSGGVGCWCRRRPNPLLPSPPDHQPSGGSASSRSYGGSPAIGGHVTYLGGDLVDRSWLGHYLGEAAGVFLIVLFGDAVMFAAVLSGAVPDIITAGLGWGLAVGLAVWANATISGAHFNPGVTLVMALRRKFPWKH